MWKGLDGESVEGRLGMACAEKGGCGWGEIAGGVDAGGVRGKGGWLLEDGVVGEGGTKDLCTVVETPENPRRYGAFHRLSWFVEK